MVLTLTTTLGEIKKLSQDIINKNGNDNSEVRLNFENGILQVSPINYHIPTNPAIKITDRFPATDEQKTPIQVIY